DELRHRPPPGELTPERWWAGLKRARHSMANPLPLRDQRNRPMMFTTPAPVLRMLHGIDRRADGSVGAETPLVASEGRNRYLITSLIEESIASSQLEGAATTRKVAKAMLRSNRPPHGRSERMVLNNYRAMQAIRALRDQALTPDMILELHRIICADTLDDPAALGRLRKATDRIHVVAADSVTVLHQPPSAATLPRRLQRLCDFANQRRSEQAFVHPVIRAIALHFMLGYDHPFADGNGRTARALFYWSMARSGYWLMEYASISRLLRRAPAKYQRAYLHTETDGNDTTYFIIHQLKVIERAIEALHQYIAHQSEEQRGVEELLQHSPRLAGRLNHRQTALLGHALRHSGYGYTVESHRRSHRVTKQTARTDLLSLAELNLLERSKRARAFWFHAPDDLRARLEKPAARRARTRRAPAKR
ncbi:MAG: Fic family protein, partial [bacterium]